MWAKQITGLEKRVTLTVATTGNSYLNLSTFGDRFESGVSNPAGVALNPNRAYYMEVTASQNFYAVIDRDTTTVPTTTDFQHVGTTWSFLRAGHGETDGRDLYLHALTDSGTVTLSITVYPLESLRAL